jgi:hypothetical protein
MSLATKRVVLAWLCAGVLAAVACAGGPTSPGASSAVSGSARTAAGTLASSVSPRSGDLQVTKDCHSYAGQPGDSCTITSSNLDAIEVHSTVVYAQAADFSTLTLDSDVVINPPKPGNNHAFGHCHLNLATGVGLCTFSGGTGKFTHFHGSANVSQPNPGAAI